MPDEDARLTDFLDADDGTEADAGGDDDRPDTDEGQSTPGGDGAQSDTVDDGGDPTPAVPTSDWTTGGTCAACGSTVERRWREDGALVCADCKDW